jgi:hypothetical protein
MKHACVLLIAVALTGVLWSQTGTGTINGSLANADGTPNVNAKVSALYYGVRPVETVVYSDAGGSFSFPGIPVGKTVSVVVYDNAQHVVGKGSATIQSPGDTVTVSIQAVPVEKQG